MGKIKNIILLATSILVIVLVCPTVWAIEVDYSAEQYCDQEHFYPSEKRSISTITVGTVGTSQAFMAGPTNIGKTPIYFSLLGVHDGSGLHPGKPFFIFGQENTFIPELTYAVPKKSYLALTYARRESEGVRGSEHQDQDLRDSDPAITDADASTIRPEFESSWMWGLRGLIEVICLPDPEQACIFLENNPFGRAGDIYLRNQSFCGSPRQHREENEGYEHHE